MLVSEPLGFPDMLSDFRANPIIDMADQGEVLELLISSKELLDIHFFDQSEYLKRHLKTLGLGLEQDAEYFWIFRNLDYEKWAHGGDKAKILGLHGPSTEDLEFAASHVVRSLQDSADPEGEVLYFFYNSTRRELVSQDDAGLRDLVCVWNLLRQLIEGRPTAAKSLLQTFLRTALDFLGDDELTKLRIHGDPTEAFRLLFCHSKPQALWIAFGQVLEDLEDPEDPRKQGLTLIIDLNSMASGWEGLVNNIRSMRAGSRQCVRVLLSNLPEGSNLGQNRPTEILLEYDKERKGMYSPWLP